MSKEKISAALLDRAQEAYRQHRKAAEAWRHGEPARAWED